MTETPGPSLVCPCGSPDVDLRRGLLCGTCSAAVAEEAGGGQPDVSVLPAPGTTGHNTISRAELGAYFKRHGYGRPGDRAMTVFKDIAAHREPEPDEIRQDTEPDAGLLGRAWGVIANAGWDDCAKSPGWQEAAVRWRDDYHRWLDLHLSAADDRPAAALCPGCLHDGVLERTVERAGAAEAKLARLRSVLLEGGQDAATVRRRALAIIGGEEGESDG